MSAEPFGRHYASHYDAIYGDKDYDAECDLLEAAFKRFAASPVRSVLDLGCGTGSHAIALAKRGYRVTGVDRSDDMLEIARRKGLCPIPTAPAFAQGDVRTYADGRQYDAVLMMFAVLGYQRTNDEVLAALRTARRHLQPGGLFLCDVWYGPAVLAIRPSDKVKEIHTAAGKLVRSASARLDVSRHLAEVTIRTRGGAQENAETHEMRFFFPQELALFMSTAGLELAGLTAMPHLDRAADESTWNAFAIARAGRR
jgi:SAM-dependent methyltransferase